MVWVPPEHVEGIAFAQTPDSLCAVAAHTEEGFGIIQVNGWEVIDGELGKAVFVDEVIVMAISKDLFPCISFVLFEGIHDVADIDGITGVGIAGIREREGAVENGKAITDRAFAWIR